MGVFTFRSFFTLLIISFLVSIPFTGCDKEEPVPSYIHIDSISLNSIYSTQGTSDHKITDAWVFVNEQYVGVYELPATFPVLYEGTQNIRIKAGIKKNGISAT